MTIDENFKYFSNKNCKYYPCHPIEEGEPFNCLFCYCPLYALGEKCGGNFTYTNKGIKNCSHCTFPHKPENYDLVLDRMKGIIELVRKVNKV
ncbi:MAG: cysteine-rich small domain-containing protein [Eubacteriales bacterium]